MNKHEDQLIKLKAKMREKRLCVCPDRHEPSMLCGYPLPCPHHTVEIDFKEFDELLDQIADSPPFDTGGITYESMTWEEFDELHKGLKQIKK